MQFEYPTGATKIDPDESTGLIPLHINTQEELNEFEAHNILEAIEWLSTANISNFLTIEFVKRLHDKMFSNTWKWAGKFRSSEKNIGVAPYDITTKLRILLDDISYQISNNTYPLDEIAYRFHHRLVQIHPFSNGNGRHARLMTDIIHIKAKHPKFSWGSQDLQSDGLVREKYINALRAADSGDYSLLAKFVRS